MKSTELALLGGKPVRNKPFASHPVMGREERAEVLSVLKTGLLSGFIAKAGETFLGGPKVRELEALFSRYFGSKFAVAMNSATSALHAALLAVGVEPGDEVLVTPYSMCASATSIVMCGGIPVFVDIEPETFCIDPSKMEARITKKTKAIVVVHLFGHPADMKPILSIAKKHSLKIIEDCAQAPAAKYHGRFAGTIGDIGIFSLNQHKTITTGEGGVALTDDKKLALKLQLIRNHGEVIIDDMPEAKGMACIGWNYRMTDTEAAIGIAQFKKLNKLTDHRVRLAKALTQKLKKIKEFDLPSIKKDCTHVYFVYPIRYDERKTGIPRKLFVRAMDAEGVPLGAGYVRPIYWERMYRERRIYERSSFPFDLQSGKNLDNYKRGSCPTTEHFHEKGLLTTNLCRYPLSETDMQDIATAVKKVLGQKDALLKYGKTKTKNN